MQRFRPLRATSAIAALTLLAAPGLASASTGKVAWMADGDTFRLESGEGIRIAGIDCSETQTGRGRCGQDLALDLTAHGRTPRY